MNNPSAPYHAHIYYTPETRSLAWKEAISPGSVSSSMAISRTGTPAARIAAAVMTG